MKANLRGLSGIKGLLLKHVEKLGMLVVAACALWFVYGSMSIESLPAANQADRLKDLVKRTNNTIDEFKWDDADPADVVKVRPVNIQTAKKLKPPFYATSQSGLNRPVVRPSVLRTDPLLFTVQDLEVSSGSGLLASIDDNIREQRRSQMDLAQEKKRMKREADKKKQQRNSRRGQGDQGGYGIGMGGADQKDPEFPNRRRVTGRARPAGIPISGDERIDKVYWATIVAKVPIQDQLNMYLDALENSRQYSPIADCPQYLGYFVERAEVKPGVEPKWQKLMTVMSTVIEKKTKDWARSQPELVDPRAVDPILTYPLPPVVGHNWDKNVTHSEIPLAADVAAEEDEIKEEPGEEVNEDGEFDFTTGTAAPKRRGGGRRYGGGGVEGGYGMEDGYDGMEDGYGGGGGYGMEGGYGKMGGGGGLGRQQNIQSAPICQSDVPHLLFRYFDFTVRPGKRYRYRVRLAMADVNNGVRDGVLDPEVMTRRAALKSDKARGYRTTDWSDASPVASIPLSGSVRLVSIKPSSKKLYNAQPTVKLLVQSFDVDEKHNAIQAAKKQDFTPGSVANMVSDVEILVAGNRFIDKMDDVHFHTGITVVDIEGGQSLTKKLSVPGRVLLMDPGGRLYVRDELLDKSEVELHTSIFSKPKKGRGGDTQGYGEFGGF